MKSFNKASKVKHSNKRKVSIVKYRKLIKTKDDFDRIIKANKVSSSAVFCMDRNNKQIGIWAVSHSGSLNFVAQDVLCEARLYASDDLNAEYFDYMPVVDGYGVDIDAFPTFKDWVQFPITNVEIVSSEKDVEICKLLVGKGMYTVINPKEIDAKYYIKHHNSVSVGFQCQHNGEYFHGKDFIHATVERGDISRINWLKNHNVSVYEVVKRDGDIILEIKKI